MKKIIILLAAVLTLTLVAFLGCNSSSSPSHNQEGIVEITGPRK